MAEVVPVATIVRGGLQEEVIEFKANWLFTLVFITTGSGPPLQVASQPMFNELPPIVFARVAVTLCPTLVVHVALEWVLPTLYPWVQQYPLTANCCRRGGLVRAEPEATGAVITAGAWPLERSV